MAGAVNGIIGEDYGMAIPETNLDDTQLIEEEKAAKYSRSHEYKKLKAHFQARIEHYQKLLPTGKPLSELVSLEELGSQWLIANSIIEELTAVMNYYETADEIVKKNGRV